MKTELKNETKKAPTNEKKEEKKQKKFTIGRLYHF